VSVCVEEFEAADAQVVRVAPVGEETEHQREGKGRRGRGAVVIVCVFGAFCVHWRAHASLRCAVSVGGAAPLSSRLRSRIQPHLRPSLRPRV